MLSTKSLRSREETERYSLREHAQGSEGPSLAESAGSILEFDPSSDRISTREQLLHLLAEASEFEHNLLCCYLYAAFSLKRRGSGDLTHTEAQAVEKWRECVMGVAVEEMTHLVLVGNLAVSIGGDVHLNRPNLPVAEGYHPAGIVIELAPFDMQTLGHFIYLESPQEDDLSDSPAFAPTSDLVRGARHGARLMPTSHDYQSIAQFYESIQSGFKTLARKLGEPALFVGDRACQIGPEVVSMTGLSAVHDLASALRAITTIVEQGEGSSKESDDSHFARFKQIKADYEALLSARSDFAPARPAARNPVMRSPASPTDRVLIEHPQAAAMLDLANALYNQMLRLVSQSFAKDIAVSSRRQLIEGAIGLMHVFAAVSEHLTTLPANNEGHTNAGVTFAMIRATEPLREGGRQWALVSERLVELAQGMREVCEGIEHLQWGIAKLDNLARTFNYHASAV